MMKVTQYTIWLFVVANLMVAEKVRLVCKDKSQHCLLVKEDDVCQKGSITRMLCRRTCKACECKDSDNPLCGTDDICTSQSGRMLCPNTCNACEFEVLPPNQESNEEDLDMGQSTGQNDLNQSGSNDGQSSDPNESGANDKIKDSFKKIRQKFKSKGFKDWFKQLQAMDNSTNGNDDTQQQSTPPGGNTSDDKPKDKNSEEELAEDGSLSNECLTAHNEKRAKHKNTPPLKWASSLESSAQAWADKMAASGNFGHSSGNEGENIAWRSNKDTKNACEKAVQDWYDEIKDYNFNNHGGGMTGHFTQIVWKSSTELGCGVSRSGKGVYTVCQYLPAGNFIGRYAENVAELA